MSVLEFAQWIQGTGWATYLRMSAYIYPVILASHLTGIALFAGAVLVTDLRLLGVVLRNQPVSDVVNQLRWPKRIGFLIVATCGIPAGQLQGGRILLQRLFQGQAGAFRAGRGPRAGVSRERLQQCRGARSGPPDAGQSQAGGRALTSPVDQHRLRRTGDRLHRAAAR